MKFFNKFNRGALAFVLVIIIFTGYVIGQSVSRRSQQEKIANLCADFAEDYLYYSVLPKDARENPSALYAEVLYNRAKDGLAKYFPEEYGEYMFSIIGNAIYEQLGYAAAQSPQLITKFEQSEFHPKKYKYSGDTVTLTMEAVTEYSTYNAVKEDVETQTVQDTFVLRKIKGEWKIIAWSGLNTGLYYGSYYESGDFAFYNEAVM